MRPLACLVFCAAVMLSADVTRLTPGTFPPAHDPNGVDIMVITSDACPASEDMLRMFSELSVQFPDITFTELDLDESGFNWTKEELGELTEPMFSVCAGDFADDISGVFTQAELEAMLIEWRAACNIETNLPETEE